MDDRGLLIHTEWSSAHSMMNFAGNVPAAITAKSNLRIVDCLGATERDLVTRFEPMPHPNVDGNPLVTGAALDLAVLAKALSSHDFAALLPTALRRAVPRRQLAWLGGRLCAERALEQLGVCDAGVPRGAHGEPVWPAGIAGSITHTEALACAVVTRRADQAGLGIDSEMLVDTDAQQAVAAVCCTPLERDKWLRGPDVQIRTTLLFAAKEAFYKAAWPAVRRFVDFEEAVVDGWDPASRSLALRLGPTMVPAVVTARYRVDEVRAVVHVRVTLDEALVARLAASAG
jgi:enterobactin synthetase component D